MKPTETIEPPAAYIAGAPAPEPAPAPPPAASHFLLTCTNNSTVQGERYFLVGPPPLTLAPPQVQVFHPMVSDPTVPGDDDTSVAVMNWAVPPDGLAFVTLAPKQAFANATQRPVTLAQTVTVSWVNGQLEAAAAPGGPDGAIDVVFAPGIPAGAVVGLAAGPGAVTFAVPAGTAKVTITPNLQPTFAVQFGTAPTDTGFSDLSAAQNVTFIGPNASITVGPDNVIRQTG